MRKESGFTIVEVIIVIALLAIMTAVGIPNYLSWLPDIRLKSAARNLKSDMMLVQQRAIRLNANVAIVFTPGTQNYVIFVDNGAGGGAPNDWTRNGTEELMKSETMPNEVTMDLAAFGAAAEQRVRFNGRGLPNESGEVRLSNTKNIIRRINLSITGRATIDLSADGGGTWSDGE